MNEEVFINLIEKEFGWLMCQGFKVSKIDKNIIFEKKFEHTSHAIKFHWGEYHVIKIQGISLLKRFNKIEEVIAKTLNEKVDFTIRKPWRGEVPKEFHTYANDNLLTGSIYISNEEQVEQFSNLVNNFFKNEATHFFDLFCTIGDVAIWLENNPVEEHSNLLVLNQNAMMLRKLILLKEANSNDFEELYTRYKAFLRKKYEVKESPYVKMYEAFRKFDNYFTSYTE